MAEKWNRMLRSVEEQDIAMMDADLHEDFMFVVDPCSRDISCTSQPY